MPVGNAATSDVFTVSTPSDREICLTRIFDAPRPFVFEVMSKPEHITRWWGRLGDGYSVPVCEVDFRLGGTWRYVNQMPNGELVAFHGVYRELAPPERMVFTEIYEAFPDTESVVTVLLTEMNGKTKMSLTAKYPSLMVRDMVLKTGMEKGAAISYDRLEEVALELAAARATLPSAHT